MRKDVLGTMMFADDIASCGDDETDMTLMAEYLESWGGDLGESIRGSADQKPNSNTLILTGKWPKKIASC